MSETTQTYLGLESTSTPTNPGFQSVLDYIRERATSEYRKGELFERLMLTYLTEDPDYKEQFSEVYLYKQWAAHRTQWSPRFRHFVKTGLGQTFYVKPSAIHQLLIKALKE